MVSWGPYISARVLAKFSGLTQGLDFWLRSEMTDFGLKWVKDFKMWAAHYQKLNPPPPTLTGRMFVSHSRYSRASTFKVESCISQIKLGMAEKQGYKTPDAFAGQHSRESTALCLV